MEQQGTYILVHLLTIQIKLYDFLILILLFLDLIGCTQPTIALLPNVPG